MASQPAASEPTPVSKNVSENQYKSEKVCRVCSAPFNIITKKHVCKFCFHAVCGPCSKGEIFSPKYKKNSRCCDGCYKVEFSQRENFKQAHIEELQHLLLRNEEEMEKERSQHLAVSKQLTEVQETVARMEATNKSEGLAAMRTLQQKLDRKKKKTDQMRDKLENNANEFKALQEQLEAAQRMLARLEDQVAEAHQREEEEVSTTVRMLETRLASKKDKKKLILTQIEEERKLKEELTEHIAALEGRIEELQVKQQTIAAEKATASEQASVLQAQLKALRGELLEQKNKKGLLDVTLTKIAELRTEIETKSQESEALMGKITKKKAKSAESKAKISDYTEKIAIVEGQMGPLIKCLSELQQFRTADAAVMENLSGERKVELQELEHLKELVKVRTEVAEKEQSHLQAMEEAFGKLSAQLAELQSSEQTTLAACKTLKAENEGVKEEIEKRSTDLPALSEELKRVKEEVDSKNATVASLEARIEALEKAPVPVSDKKCMAGCHLF